MEMFNSDVVDQLNIVKESNENFLNISIFNQEFKNAVNNIDIKKYKDDPDKDTIFYKYFGFTSDNYKEIMQQAEKDIFDNLVYNVFYKKTILKYFNINSNYFIKYSIVKFQDTKVQLLKTHINKALDNQIYGAHIIPITGSAKLSLYRKNIISEDNNTDEDYSLYTKVDHSYDGEYIFKCEDNLYYGCENESGELVKFFSISFIKK